MVGIGAVFTLARFSEAFLVLRAQQGGIPIALVPLVLVTADLVLALSHHWTTVLAGVALWGIHMGMTRGLLATMVADTAPADLRGTAYGFFNLVSGIAMLIASVVAGLLWDQLGASFTFYAGAGFCGIALLALLRRL